jgi:hypothetical protein
VFRFTIRDVLWLTVVVGLSVGWWLDHHEGLGENYRLILLVHHTAQRIEDATSQPVYVSSDKGEYTVFPTSS